MSESVSIPVRTSKQAEAICSFLTEHSNKAAILAGVTDPQHYWYSDKANVWCEAYSNHQGIDQDVLRAIICYMALRAGRKRRVKEGPGYPTPYFTYVDSFPVLLDSDHREYAVDELGMRSDLRGYTELLQFWRMEAGTSEEYEALRVRYGMLLQDPSDWEGAFQDLRTHAVPQIRKAMEYIDLTLAG